MFLNRKRSTAKGLGWAPWAKESFHVFWVTWWQLMGPFLKSLQAVARKGLIIMTYSPSYCWKKPILDYIRVNCNRFQGKILTWIKYFEKKYFVSIFRQKKPKTFNNLNNSDLLCRQYKLRQLVWCKSSVFFYLKKNINEICALHTA